MFERLPKSSTETIDRSKTVILYYRNKAIEAYEGDTVAAALMAAGVRVFGRSFKYHRPRGAHCLSGNCARCAMIVDGRPNVRTCQTLVRKGMRVEPQSKIDNDPLVMADKMSWLLPTGFYYKAFHKPSWVWPHAIKMIRKAPGALPKVKALSDRAGFDHVNLSPELLVIGGGVAGLEAALLAAKAGVRVVLVDSEPRLGGFELFQGERGQAYVQEMVDAIQEFENATLLSSTVASAMYPDGLVFCVQAGTDQGYAEKAYLVDPCTVVVATGAISKPMIFSNNDRPGILLPEASQKLLHLHSLKPKGKVVVAGGDDYMARVALDLVSQGVEVKGFVDYRREGFDRELVAALGKAGVPVLQGHILRRARGERWLEAVELAEPGSQTNRELKADLLIASSGRSTKHKLLGMIGAKIVFRPELNLHLPQVLPRGYHAAGRLMGLEDRESIRLQGRLAAAEALAEIGLDMKAAISDAREGLAHIPKSGGFVGQPIRVEDPAKTFVCYCNDVTVKDLDTAFGDGFHQVESIKRYTTATMGLCQGGMCESNFSQLLARKHPQMEARHLPTPRPAAFPMSLGALASGHGSSVRHSPLHQVQEKYGAKAKRIGPWLRVEDFGDPEKEVFAVHNAAALLDVSTLGKFRIHGPDAEKLWNRINTNRLEKLKGKKILYTATCNEEGVLLDDGIAVKIADHDYYFTTSTARAALTPAWYARWAREEDWKVWLVNLTDNLAGINLAGPRAREILAKLTNSDLSKASLPYMHWDRMDIAGVKTMVFRMGFMGQLSYEIHCPSSQSAYLWEKMLQAGTPLGLRPAGTEALLTCRLEKGHVLPGIDTDGYTTLHEAGMTWLWDQSKEELVGGPMLRLLKDKAPKLSIAGFSVAGRVGIKEGFLVVNGSERLGYVTSQRYSAALNKTVGLALIKPGPDIREGGHLNLAGDGQQFKVPYQRPPFYDPKGERMRA